MNFPDKDGSFFRTNLLYYRNNLETLQKDIHSETIDLCYCDPPFNSARNYFVIFKDRTGLPSQAQMQAFSDTWQWGDEAERTFVDIPKRSANQMLLQGIRALREMLGETAMTAYLVSMAARFVEIHRVLKPTGSFYLHCDPTASHYLKFLLDAIFGPENFRNEIIWKRQSAHSDAKKRFANVTDSILFYAKSPRTLFRPLYEAHDPTYLQDFYKHDDKDGRGAYRRDNMTSPNIRPNLTYEWKGFSPPLKGWRYSRETMTRLDAEGRIYYPRLADGTLDTSRRPALKRYLSEQEGSIVTNCWTDISPVQARGESLGYPTQKPVALLKRIIEASTDPGDVVLDCYCGCGTALVAAHELRRNWIGIDVAPVATAIMRKRLTDTFDDLAKTGVPVIGFPTDLEGARMLFEENPHSFQGWACIQVGAYPNVKKGSDGGVDGGTNFFDYDESEHKLIVQVKGGKNIGPAHIRDFIGTMAREKARLGFFVTLNEPTKAMREEAMKAGTWTNSYGNDYRRVQILTVEGLLSGREVPKMPHQEKRSLLGYTAKKISRRGEQAALDLE